MQLCAIVSDQCTQIDACYDVFTSHCLHRGDTGVKLIQNLAVPHQTNESMGYFRKSFMP